MKVQVDHTSRAHALLSPSSSSGNFIYDGKPFFASAHPDKVGNTYANATASGSLTHTNLKTIYTTYTSTNNRDERGQIVTITPDTLLIPPACLS